MSDEAQKQTVLDYLMKLEGKGVQTIMDIAKGTGLKRKECSKILRSLEEEGKVASAGVMAGVAGYKAVK
jgi:DNA-binding Lrp family transcriptional regulator